MTESMAQWFIKVRDTVYGPYSEARMAAFVSEGRLSGRSMVCATNDGEFHAASEEPGLEAYLNQNNASKATDRPAAHRRFVIFAQIDDESRGVFLQKLAGFGVAIEAMPNVWLLNAQARADGLRNAMSQVLGSQDSLFIADASKGSSAWFNIGQDADGRIRQFWQESE